MEEHSFNIGLLNRKEIKGKENLCKDELIIKVFYNTRVYKR